MHRSEQLRYFVKPKLKSPRKGTDNLEKKLKHRNLKNNYKEEKVIKWTNQLKVLRKTAVVELTAAYSAFVGGFKHEVKHTIRTMSNIHIHLEKLDQAADIKFIPILNDGHFCNKMEMKLLSCPIKYGGMGLVIFCDIAENEYKTQEL